MHLNDQFKRLLDLATTNANCTLYGCFLMQIDCEAGIPFVAKKSAWASHLKPDFRLYCFDTGSKTFYWYNKTSMEVFALFMGKLISISTLFTCD